MLNSRIACLCSPTLYKKLLEIKPEGCEAKVFEYDRRFSVFGEDFVFYDYKKPLDLPASVTEHSFDIVVADPPFLSEECLRKTAETIKYLGKEKIILCTGKYQWQVQNCLDYSHLSYTESSMLSVAVLSICVDTFLNFLYKIEHTNDEN